ncbi:Stp1/IreP family PP2C-type Ser/Thr phosphatase [Streptomyces europaeiscabiei]|uniref:Stp1/IreP family PP2C-type Ser/Thr phosphatase n=1 Tax=Streptomyces europaeiscabiei TaxID=146819 RepID=A0ABU4NJD4_9ACTN|nr:Stp1/IreP family PP2C-type Ser/Thr phosphatase [Streptomyces europaeiscabiei]MDX2527727.1 Stp1/IreP family PP2C-type Ser/Thr phosphatase [Streptomyces europaeiscabiei]MDX2758698.1 Stp1/IreP family PP2C-type Ser/Thr phosphatase [Streptomyces europaeiscabiei]MDX2767821.1 Stp1/IreP family PP2C-type Ser/Thr phosphatase [Streptomyces europaeiscabiei]MDX3545006.1 Stp1/IreP family PP2C-type Ser/Thr phosphatase [Streptomyces europaeiscabiei]MDX3554694.1 Stp1/IreP family PP2C-type Ser/Thr phosphatas
MSLSLRFAAGSHKGMIREGNEDSGYAGPRLLAIADGMGGQAAGEVASSEVISTLVTLDDDIPGSDILTSLGTAVQRANDQLRAMVEEDPQLEGMGTTLTALLWTGQRLGLVHVGDSRAYLLRDGVLTQITQDHTWVQRLVDEGRITEEEATTHPQRSLLMRALGSGDHVEPDLSIREVRAGDRYLICSDGLSGVVSHQTMEETLASYQGPQETVQELIQLALRGGGPDNITVIIADVLDLDTGDTLAGQLSDTPVVVGAVAENQLHLQDNGIMQTPAGRASGLGRQGHGQGGGEFGPPGSGDATGYMPAAGSFDDYSDDDFVKPRKKRRWLKRSFFGILALAVVGGGLYSGYRWTQTQYYVGANDDHVALYRGISQDLAWISLSNVEKDHPEIELKYLPSYQQKLVEATIAEGGLNDAEKKITELSTQASACKKNAERREAADNNAKTGEGEAGGVTGTTKTSLTSKATPSPTSTSSTSPTPTQTAPTPSTGPSLSEEEQDLVSRCGEQ